MKNVEEEKKPEPQMEGKEHFGPWGKFGFFGGGFPFAGPRGEFHHGPHGHHGPHHDKPRKSHSKGKDENFVLTKKAFKMADKFGGNPDDYIDFIKPRIDMRPYEIFQAYCKEKNVDMKKFE